VSLFDVFCIKVKAWLLIGCSCVYGNWLYVCGLQCADWQGFWQVGLCQADGRDARAGNS